MPDTVSISIIVPVHNEEDILATQVLEMVRQLGALPWTFEILLVENGSTDRTPSICRDLASQEDHIRVISLAEGDYGRALREGILRADHDIVAIFNVEFWNTEFISIAVAALQTRTLVIGSKSAPGAHDDRPFVRRVITQTYNRCLWALWGFRGTETHGMKAFMRRPLLDIVSRCVCKGFVFDTELVLRCERAGISMLELPTDVAEIRPPSHAALMKRIPSVVHNLWVLWRALR